MWIRAMLWWVTAVSLRPSDAIWRQWSWTTLAQVMACCLTAPSHYLNQCWLIIRGVLWHTSESSFAGIAQGIDSGYEFEKDILKNIFKSPRGQRKLGHCSHTCACYVPKQSLSYFDFPLVEFLANIGVRKPDISEECPWRINIIYIIYILTYMHYVVTSFYR